MRNEDSEISLSTHIHMSFLLSCFFKKVFSLVKDFVYLFLERGEGREKERERNIDWLPLACPQQGTWPATQACALTGTRMGDPLVCRLGPSLLSPTPRAPVLFTVVPSQVLLKYSLY